MNGPSMKLYNALKLYKLNELTVNTADTNHEVETKINYNYTRKDKLQLLAATARLIESQEMITIVRNILDLSNDNAALSDKDNKETILSYFKDN
eukprot:56611_1